MAKRIREDIIRKNCKAPGWQNRPSGTSSKWQKLKYIRRREKRGNRVTLNKLEARCVTKFPYFGYSSAVGEGRKLAGATKLREKLATLQHRLWKYRNAFTRTKAERVKYESHRRKEWLYYVSLKLGFRARDVPRLVFRFFEFSPASQ